MGKNPRRVARLPRRRSLLVVRYQCETGEKLTWHTACKYQQPTCKPRTPNQPHPQPCSAANGGVSACFSSSKPSNVAHGVVRRRRRSWFRFRRMICGTIATRARLLLKTSGGLPRRSFSPSARGAPTARTSTTRFSTAASPRQKGTGVKGQISAVSSMTRANLRLPLGAGRL